MVEVHAHYRDVPVPEIATSWKTNHCHRADGLCLLRAIDSNTVPVVFLDPQYRGVLDWLSLGNEGARESERVDLPQMSDGTIAEFIMETGRVLVPSGHLFLWVDKFHLCNNFSVWLDGSGLRIVDMITWDKGKNGMGYRTRRRSEYLVVAQKEPAKVKGVWQVHDIPDVWPEKVIRKRHPHMKPIGLMVHLIEAVTGKGDLVVDPAAGSFVVFEACMQTGRVFLGCDINR